MPNTSGNFPKAMSKNMKKLSVGMAMKMDKKADAAMSPAMLKKDISADKKLLAKKVKK